MKTQSRLTPLALIAVAWLGMVLCPLYAVVLGGASRAMAGAPKIARDGITGAPIHLDKGAELGRFKLGSTAIVLFGPEQVKWAQELTAGSPVMMGQKIGE